MYYILLVFWLSICFSCNQPTTTTTTEETVTDTLTTAVELPIEPPIPAYGFDSLALDSVFALNDTAWVELKRLDTSFVLDIRYATTNNFMELQIYDCPKCFTRLATAKALLKAQKALSKQGLGFKFFDCYRPQSAQYKLWQKVPDPRYVSPPTRGSMHSRGGALDLTIVQLDNHQELEMGTTYDYFGKEAYWSYKKHAPHIQQNRQLLLETLKEYGFKTVSTEWWHFSYRRAWFKLSDMQWDCASN